MSCTLFVYRSFKCAFLMSCRGCLANIVPFFGLPVSTYCRSSQWMQGGTCRNHVYMFSELVPKGGKTSNQKTDIESQPLGNTAVFSFSLSLYLSLSIPLSLVFSVFLLSPVFLSPYLCLCVSFSLFFPAVSLSYCLSLSLFSKLFLLLISKLKISSLPAFWVLL